MARTISRLLLVASVLGAAGTALAAERGGVKAGTGSCTFQSMGTCWENYKPELCTEQKFSPGAACPTADRVGTCKTGDGRTMRLYKKTYTEENAAGYCSALSGKFEKG